MIKKYIGKKVVLQFINDFKRLNPEVIETLFTKGYCFWFAYILRGRFDFANYHSVIYYNDIDNHFICRIGKYFYDITGEVKDIKNFVPWEDYQCKEYSNSLGIFKYCILKEYVDDDEDDYV